MKHSLLMPLVFQEPSLSAGGAIWASRGLARKTRANIIRHAWRSPDAKREKATLNHTAGGIEWWEFAFAGVQEMQPSAVNYAVKFALTSYGLWDRTNWSYECSHNCSHGRSVILSAMQNGNQRVQLSDKDL
ncbi:hypothetical protein CIHG_06474 [Coccidioides immitis H538.4]|uniref:Uncharacterized protein n=2 Tax=Coccidioides immitis TaxID=5501 RepID=A0A0J8RW40_COCIT|nr:hypothetical protein CIRG_10287 [Coccidioides immitis RMSCC 2394]KMU88806.1 hypothetical protein CIHG_06474 [Coccidioides immitis H538.4]